MKVVEYQFRSQLGYCKSAETPLPFQNLEVIPHRDTDSKHNNISGLLVVVVT